MSKQPIKTEHLISSALVERRIYLIRGHKVLLDTDLATLYGVKPTRLREQVKRNKDRFPEDFMFQFTKEEAEFMVSQNAIPSAQHLGGSLPYAFTQEGVAMLSSVLRSERAVQVNIAIMRAFVKLRDLLASNKDLAAKLETLERKYQKHDSAIKEVFRAIYKLMEPEELPEQQRIGFRHEK